MLESLRPEPEDPYGIAKFSFEQELAVKLELGEPLERGTGVVIVTDDEHRRYDSTLETRLSRMQASLRTPVYHILMEATP